MFQNLICSCAYELLYWKHVHTIRNKKRNEGQNERISGQWKMLESEPHSVLVCRLRRSVSGEAREDLKYSHMV